MAAGATHWYRDPAARRLILLGYVPWLAGVNLAWETAQAPFYTLWRDASPGYIAFSIVHCTLGDIAIGASALILALLLTRAGALAVWRWGRIAALTALIGTAYTVFSEWMNTIALQNWKYAESMPILRAFGLEIGVAPLLQWLLIPPLALFLGKRWRPRLWFLRK